MSIIVHVRDLISIDGQPVRSYQSFFFFFSFRLSIRKIKFSKIIVYAQCSMSHGTHKIAFKHEIVIHFLYDVIADQTAQKSTAF